MCTLAPLLCAGEDDGMQLGAGLEDGGMQLDELDDGAGVKGIGAACSPA